MKRNNSMAIVVISSVLVLSGCGAMGTAIKKRNLDVKTQMSETIWLEPSNNRTVYLQIKNTSDKDMSGLQTKIASAVTAKGYQVVTNPDTAGYWIQANVLKADKTDLRESQGWLSKGYEGATTAAALGAGITAYNSNSAGATLGLDWLEWLQTRWWKMLTIRWSPMSRSQKEPRQRSRQITLPYCTRGRPDRRYRPVQKQVISINTRPVLSRMPIKLI